MVEKPRVFSKTYGDRELFLEGLENSREAWEIGRGTEFFSTPPVLDSDEQGLTIDFELLCGWITVLDLLRSWRFRGIDRTELLSVFRRIGRAIAEYHRATGRIHGDLYPDNVLFRPGEAKIRFVDFSRPDPPLYPDGRPYDRGTVYTDLALFTIYTTVKYPFARLPQAFRPTNRVLARAFLAGYFEQAGAKYDHKAFRAEYDRLFREGGVLPGSLIWRHLRWTHIFMIDDLAP